MYNKPITDDMILQLRQNVKQCMSQARYEHTLGVETMAVYIGKAFGTIDLNKISAAALLHDITKEYSFSKQLKICEEFGIMLRDDEISSPAIIHAITGATIIPYEYVNFSDNEIISCVRWHTTGKREMSLPEKIIYLSDYIEPTRAYCACVALRREFCRSFNTSNNYYDRLRRLNNAVVEALEQTVKHLVCKGTQVNSDTLEALSFIKSEVV